MLDVGVHEVRREGAVIPLPPLSFDLLLTLAKHAPNLVSSERLAEEVWPGLVVSPGTVVKRVGLLREAIGDDAEHPRYVSVVRGRGYRLIPPVEIDLPGPAMEAGDIEAAGASSRRKVALFAVALTVVVAVTAGIAFSLSDRRTNGNSVAVPTKRPSAEAAALTEPPGEAQEPSIAVLPFMTLTQDAQDLTFANGLAEEIINLLAAVNALKVAARTSSFVFDDGETGADEIAQQLNVNHILEGSVQRHGGRIRVTAQLIDVRTGYHVWSQKYDRPFEDVLAVQDDIALNIATALKVRMDDRERPDSIRDLTGSAAAYELYLQGRNLLHHRIRLEGAGLNAAVSALEKAVRLDPKFARAWAGLGTALWLRPGYRNNENRADDHQRAEQAANTALELNPDLAEAQAVLGSLAWKTGDFEQAGHWFDRAMQQSAQDSDVWLWAGMFLDSVGYVDDAFRIYERANRIDPFNQNLIGFLSRSFRIRGDAEKAESLVNTLETSIWRDYSLAVTKLAAGDLAAVNALLAGHQMPFGTFPPSYVKLATDALQRPEQARDAEKRILDAMESSGLSERVAFELLWIMGSLAILEVAPEISDGYRALRVSEIAWSDRGKSIRQDERFHEWVGEVGLVDYWNRHGWPESCRPAQDNTLVCN